ncbi:MAG: type III-A CRISPR-associated RAMP protein Csm3 [Tissierellia bacterium]|nr:type III-A CRISPR-associated RAMP protein Csm3 [Tissierellia bacterium]
MYGKLEITGIIRVETGMHIGGEGEFSAIGAIDSPVMRDKLTDLPYIPGSSFKGKMRYLLQNKYGDNEIKLNATHNDDDYRILRLFGSSNNKGDEVPKKSRLYFSDSFLSNKEEFENKGIDSVTEVKAENTINRFTAVANPRQIERVIRGSEFEFSIIYNVQDEEEIIEDIEILKDGFKLLSYDYLGGHGSRGYGRVKFKNLKLELLTGNLSKELIEKLKNILGD